MIGLNDCIDEVCGFNVYGYDVIKGYFSSCDDFLYSSFDFRCYIGSCLVFVICKNFDIVIFDFGRVIVVRLYYVICDDSVCVSVI